MKIINKCPCCGAKVPPGIRARIAPFISQRVFDNKVWECKTLCCPRCDLVFSDFRFSKRELTRLYLGYRGREYTDTRMQIEPEYADKIKSFVHPEQIEEVESFIFGFMPYPKTLLDWGGGDGANTPFPGSKRYIYNIDPSPPKEGIVKTSLWKAHRHYDLIVCSNVLEHTNYPLKTLKTIKRFMGRSTILFIEVPCENLVFNEKPYYEKIHWHEHINFFFPKSIVELLTRAGLRFVGSRCINRGASGTATHAYQILCRK